MNNHRKVVPLLRKVVDMSREQLLDIIYLVAETAPMTLWRVFDELGLEKLIFEEKIRAIAANESKIAAIKFYREVRHSTLKTAKEEVDRIVGQSK